MSEPSSIDVRAPPPDIHLIHEKPVRSGPDDSVQILHSAALTGTGPHHRLSLNTRAHRLSLNTRVSPHHHQSPPPQPHRRSLNTRVSLHHHHHCTASAPPPPQPLEKSENFRRPESTVPMGLNSGLGLRRTGDSRRTGNKNTEQ
jgi:hypothetical protein